MKRKKLIPAIAMTLALVCAFTLGANAAGTLQEIKAYLNSGITIKMDGVEQILKNADGSRIYPITYNNSTYLPVRAVCDMLGVGVDWDGATQTVLLGKQPSGVDLIDTYKLYYAGGNYGRDGSIGQIQTADGKTEDISGITCSHWIWFQVGNIGGVKTGVASFNLQGKHDTLTFSYYATRNGTLKVLGDNDNVLGEYDITGGEVAQTVTIPLFKTNELRFEFVMPGNSYARIFDAHLDAEQ